MKRHDTLTNKGCQPPRLCWRTVDGDVVLYGVVTVCD